MHPHHTLVFRRPRTGRRTRARARTRPPTNPLFAEGLNMSPVQFRRALCMLPILLLVSFPLAAQQAVPEAAAEDQALMAEVTLDRLFNGDFRGEFLGATRWLNGGSGYTTLESADGGGRDIVQYGTDSGERMVLVSALALVPTGAEEPLSIQSYEWSSDGSRLLIFTNTRRVWRNNTRGDYWVLDRNTGALTKLGDDAPEASLMFAKFDPAGNRVAYRQEFDLYVEDLRSGDIVRLTQDGSRTIINGTTDWVYEEEFSLRDAFLWSPDGEMLAFWQLDAAGVREYLMINDTDSLYSYTIPVQYPKAGGTNSAARVGLVPAAGGDITWIEFPGDAREHYIPRMAWAGNSDAVIIQRMNRLQNQNQVVLADATTGALTSLFTDRDDAWLDVVDDWKWLDDGKRFLWVSERDGWRHVYSVPRDGSTSTAVTFGKYDMISVELIDERGDWLYFMASPDNPTQTYLYRTRLDGRSPAERITPASQPGSHRYNMSPDGRWALHTWSRFGVPPITELIRIRGHQPVRTMVHNTTLKETIAALDRGESEFFTVNVDGIEMDGWMMRPPNFEDGRRYPMLVYGYTAPAGTTA
ncbi:MAG: S9 family peptidase, partial [Gemmatimonadetes bacterium]